MHRIDWTARALADLDRFEYFLFQNNELAAERSIVAIVSAVDGLSLFPNRGRAATEEGYRELPVRYSNSGYVVLYQVKPDVVRIVRVRHMREDDYPIPHP